MKKKTKKPKIDLAKKLAKLQDEITVLKTAHRTIREAYEAEIWEDFKKKWIGKYIKFEIGGPDLMKYGKVIGPDRSEGREYLSVLEISMNEEYGWVELQKMTWDIGRFEHYKVEELNRVEISQAMDNLVKHLNNNLETLGLKVQ